MSNSINISPKHGVNPSIDHCFWCGKEIGLALFGKLKGDAEAPRDTCTSYEPCDECKASMAQGITFMEASPTPPVPNTPPMGNAYPTGRFFILTEEAVQRIFEDGPQKTAMLEKRKCFLDTETFDYFMNRFSTDKNEETEE